MSHVVLVVPSTRQRSINRLDSISIYCGYNTMPMQELDNVDDLYTAIQCEMLNGFVVPLWGAVVAR